MTYGIKMQNDDLERDVGAGPSRGQGGEQRVGQPLNDSGAMRGSQDDFH